jgi:hypothetical protein
MLPKNTTFVVKSGTFLATSTELMNGAQAITDTLAPRGLAVAGGGSGGGIWPWPANYAGSVRLLRAMDEDEARGLVADAIGNAFTVVTAAISSWQNTTAAIGETAAGTVADVKADAQIVADKAFPLAAVVTIAIASVAVIVVASKF